MKKTKILTYISGAVTIIGSLGMFTGFLPQQLAALILGIAGPLGVILTVVGDYLDDGEVNGSFLKRTFTKGASVFVAGLLLLASLGIVGTQIGCSTIQNSEATKRIAWNAVKAGVNLAMGYAAKQYPQYEEEILLAREAVNLSYNIVFADADGNGETTAQEIASNITTELAANISDPETLAKIEALIASHLFGETSTAPQSNPEYTAIGNALLE